MMFVNEKTKRRGHDKLHIVSNFNLGIKMNMIRIRGVCKRLSVHGLMTTLNPPFSIA
jgi:hypothetical protein